MSMRIEKINHLLKKEIAYVIQNSLKEDVGFVSIVRVVTSKDLSVARVFYSVLGDEKAKERAKRILENANAFIRRMTAQRVRLKFFPSLDFIMDESIEHSFHMDEVFKRIHEEDKRGNKEE